VKYWLESVPFLVQNEILQQRVTAGFALNLIGQVIKSKRSLTSSVAPRLQLENQIFHLISWIPRILGLSWQKNKGVTGSKEEIFPPGDVKEEEEEEVAAEQETGE
jgi:hypothetical protein